MTTTDASSERGDSDPKVTGASTTESNSTDTDTVNGKTGQSSAEFDETSELAKPLKQPKFAMVVDDNRANRLRLEVRLLSAGVRAKTFSSSDAAMKALLADELEMPDVIILGEGTAALEGLQVIKYVKRLPRAAQIPQLHYSIKNNELCVVQARALGAVGSDAHAFDGVDLNEVLTRLKLSNRVKSASNPGASRDAVQQDETLQSLASEVDAHLDTLSSKADQSDAESAQPAEDEVATERALAADGDSSDVPDRAATGQSKGASGNDAPRADAGERQASEEARDVNAAETHNSDPSSHASSNSVSSNNASEAREQGDDATAPDDDDPFAEKPPKRLVDSQHFKGLISASASNDAESFREHTSVVAYLRSLERRGRRTPPPGRRAERWQEKRRRHKPSSDQNTWRDALGGETSQLSNNRWLGLESQRLEFQERLDRSLESLQHQMEFEMMRQTGAMQEHVGALLDAHAETLRDELLMSKHHRRVDRWLRVLVVLVILGMPLLWLMTQMTVSPAPPSPLVGEVMDEVEPEPNPVAESSQADAPVGLSDAERERVMLAVEQLLNSGAEPEFGKLALGAREATRLEQALEMLSVIDFQGTVQVINHVSPYCVQYDANGRAVLDTSQENIAQCFMMPENIVSAETKATEQSVEFGNLLSRYNRAEVPISIVVIPSVAEGDFWSTTDTFQPAATGEQLTAGDWNERAKRRNRIEYRLIGS